MLELNVELDRRTQNIVCNEARRWRDKQQESPKFVNVLIITIITSIIGAIIGYTIGIILR